MASIVQRRRELRAEARKRARDVLPRLRKAVTKARQQRAAAVRKCGTQCSRKRKRIQADAERARAELRERIAVAKQKAREACTACKVTAKAEGLDAIDRALAAVEAERQAIQHLRARAERMKSERGRAGGRRRAELQAEADDEVRRNLGDDDPVMLALFERVKHKLPKRTHASRTETFIEWAAEHPEEYAEQTRMLEAQWAREAEEHWAGLQDVKVSDLDDEDLAAYDARLQRAGEWLDSDHVPF